MSERVVVTAAHCVVPIAPDEVGFGASADEPETIIPILDARAHPQYDRPSERHDVAVLLLAAAAPAAVRPYPLLTANDALASGETLRILGYGRASAAGGETSIRREGETTIDALTDVEIFFHANPSQTCDGDSGGPAFVQRGGAQLLAGITSVGDPACVASARDARVDVHVDGFFAPYVAATAPASATTGERCFYSENCQSEQCVFPDRAPGFGYCAAPCGTNRDCPAPMACRAAQCAYLDPVPGTAGAGCAGGVDCQSQRCEASVCVDPCFPGNTNPCPDGTTCVAGQAGPFCAASTAAGCAVAGAGRNPAGWFVPTCLLAALLTGRRRCAA